MVAESMLHHWKHQEWSNELVSPSVFLGKSPTTFPSPDGTFQDPDKSRLIAIEFKPPGETKRGILTGLGQAIAYLRQYSLTYVVCPEYVEGVKIADIMVEIFSKTRLNEKVPIGLISYKNDDPSQVQILKEISLDIEIESRTSAKEDSRYWAKYMDTTPHLIWTLLDIAFKLEDNDDRRKKIYRKFFDDYYFPLESRETLQVFDSKIKLWDGTAMRPFSVTIKKLQNNIEEGTTTREEALAKIRHESNPSFTKDNLYNSYRKNYFPFLDHLGLWDDQGYLTERGYELHKQGKLHGPTSKTFKDYLTKTILVDGKHLDLILDIERSTRNQPFSTSEEARKHAYHDLEQRGLVKKNPGRAMSEDGGKFFSNEMQLWTHLGVLKKEDGTQYVSARGFLFDWDEITRIISM